MFRNNSYNFEEIVDINTVIVNQLSVPHKHFSTCSKYELWLQMEEGMIKTIHYKTITLNITISHNYICSTCLRKAIH